MQSTNILQHWVANLDRRAYALSVGILIGAVGSLIGLMMVIVGPIYTFGIILGGLLGLYILTDVQVALYAAIIVMMLLPFGTLPFSVGFTPTFMDCTIGAFIFLYLIQWMKRQRQSIQLTPVHTLVFIYLIWLVLAFALGLRYAAPTTNNIRQFVGTILSISLVFILVDLLRTPQILRRLVFVIMICAGIQSLLALVLYILPDLTAQSVLNGLGRIGYPVGNVIRYIESNPGLPERAIGTWIDPNSLGGVLAVSAVLIAPQVFANKPVLRYRWLTFFVLGLVSLALILTFSRASALAFAGGLGIIAITRYRRYIPLLILAGMLLFLLPQMRGYLERFVDAFTAQDLATQMRIGEYTDSLRLIRRYPLFGVGFTGTPDIDIYTDVASMYLIMANQIGLTGLAIFLVTISGVFVYGVSTWRYAKQDDMLDSIHLGYHAALFTAMINAVADLYFFRLEYQGSITLFWLTVTLALASSRLAIMRSLGSVSITKSAIVKRIEVV